MTTAKNSFGARATLTAGGQELTLYRLDALDKARIGHVSRLPFSLRVLLENLLRHEDGLNVTRDDVEALAGWNGEQGKEISFTPARVLLQDFTGVPAVVDLAAMRDAIVALGGDAQRINPLQPADLVIDHSVQVDHFGSARAMGFNTELENERNKERYQFLKWGQTAFQDFTVVPPSTGIVHQVNLEYIAKVLFTAQKQDGARVAYPDTLVGTDSHTTMINGLGVVGWGVGGIEAEAAMLGQPITMLIPQVTGFKLVGRLPEGATATDLVLTVTEMLRAHGVVGRFVEFFGPGMKHLSLPDRATIANMCPEYGATIGFFPVDAETLRYLRFSGRDEALVEQVEAYYRTQGMFHTDETADPIFTDTLELDLSTVVPSLSGPRLPQQRVPLTQARPRWRKALLKMLGDELQAPAEQLAHWAEGDATLEPPDAALRRGTDVEYTNQHFRLEHGKVVIAAITSCTNTSNPSVMIAAGLLAKKAVEAGLDRKPWVKTSLAPGSRVVTSYLERAGLVPYLEALGFHTVGYGCTTCIAEGTPVLQANGTARRIETLPSAGGAVVMSPNATRGLSIGLLAETMPQGERECVRLTLQDGRELVCTPDHELLTANRGWVRADALDLDGDRVIVGLEAPVDEPDPREAIFALTTGGLTLSMKTPQERLQTLAFARLLGHLLGDGSISSHGQARMNVGQALDRELVLDDIELLTGKRPVANAYDERKWAIVLPAELTRAIIALPGVTVGRRMDQPAQLPAFVLDDLCPVSVVREYLGGVFGADGHAPSLHRYGETQHASSLTAPAYAQSARPEHVEALEATLTQLTWLLGRCGVTTTGHKLYRYPVRRAESSYAPADASERIEVRLQLPDGLSFIEHVGYRYCVDKALKASAAAAYWRTVARIGEHEPCVEFLEQLGVRDWFAPLSSHEEASYAKSYCVEKDALSLPTFSLRVIDRRAAGVRRVFDLAVEEHHAFVAGSIAVHNCIGNSGPLPEAIDKAVHAEDLVVCSVLSGNRNFEGRIGPSVRANYLASPPLVVAYALAGTLDLDPYREPLGCDPNGEPVFLRDIWPSNREIADAVGSALSREQFQERYADVYAGDEIWRSLEVPTGDRFAWDESSTYVRQPPYFEGMTRDPAPIGEIKGARLLALLGDAVTTDHISPAGSIAKDSPAAQYLTGHGVERREFNSYGSRRGNHEVMMRGTFANVRLRNQLAPGTEGGWTKKDGELMSIYDAAMAYRQEGTPLMIIAGELYGSGSSRDWAAKGPALLGVRAVIAKSYERIHRSNLIGMGILPLQFKDGEGAAELGLSGTETFDILGLDDQIRTGQTVTVQVGEKTFETIARIDTPVEVEYYRHGGILHYVLRNLAGA